MTVRIPETHTAGTQISKTQNASFTPYQLRFNLDQFPALA